VSEAQDTVSTQPTTPSSVTPTTKIPVTPKAGTKPVVPAVPVVVKPTTPQKEESQDTRQDKDVAQSTEETAGDAQSQAAPASAPKSWADLVKHMPPRNSAAPTNAEKAKPIPTVSKPNPTSSAEIIKAFNVNTDAHYAFLEPRGLVNTGNMCYMNSVSLAITISWLSSNLIRFSKCFFTVSHSIHSWM
jgi:ubiquitin carboxyl-terminal hydrolase 10